MHSHGIVPHYQHNPPLSDSICSKNLKGIVPWQPIMLKIERWQSLKELWIVPHTSVQFSSIQSLSHVWLFATPWIAARQASLSITNSQSLLKLTSIESVMPSNHLILCRPLLLLLSICSRRMKPAPLKQKVVLSFSATGSFQMSQLFASGGQSIGVSASASVLPMNI